VTLSSNFLSGRLETDAIALHGDERHQPCGWTALHDSALEIRDEAGFFQEVRAVLAKSIGGEGGKKSPEELELAVRQIVSRAISSDKVIDIFDAAGLKKPDISILSDEFLSEVKR
jgi:type I restriction enzyme R subunit